jgi:aryl-alcohol dehydrogenase-like predicted oxidoreductase/enamine deaminase RidA (YjgF/YER057c/UK114 family)
MKAPRPQRIELAPGLEIGRVVTGLWQVADLERDGRVLDPEAASDELARYVAAGFDTFDMADHYGSAELIVGALSRKQRAGVVGPFRALTKWCPEPGEMNPDRVRAAVERALERMNVERIDLLQLHWWMYEHPAYLDAMRVLAQLKEEGLIGALGVTNFNTDHLRVLVRSAIPVASNQVSFSLIDRRAGEDMQAFCAANDIKLLAYGTLCGGFLSESWLDAPEPAAVSDWSKMKYGRFVAASGGWGSLQRILASAAAIARRHGVSIANVATRWVLQQQAVAAVIVGARLGEREHRDDNLRLFSFALDSEDLASLEEAFATARRIPGDCGDEYRKPPFLTASGDLSHHLQSFPKIYQTERLGDDLWRVDSGSVWEAMAGYARAIRRGDRIFVSGTTATHGPDDVVCPGDAACQAVYSLDKIAAALSALGARLEDVVQTRIYLTNADHWEEVSRVHGRYFAEIRPANTLITVSHLIGDYLVEIECEAIVARASA